MMEISMNNRLYMQVLNRNGSADVFLTTMIFLGLFVAFIHMEMQKFLDMALEIYEIKNLRMQFIKSLT